MARQIYSLQVEYIGDRSLLFVVFFGTVYGYTIIRPKHTSDNSCDNVSNNCCDNISVLMTLSTFLFQYGLGDPWFCHLISSKGIKSQSFF